MRLKANSVYLAVKMWIPQHLLIWADIVEKRQFCRKPVKKLLVERQSKFFGQGVGQNIGLAMREAVMTCSGQMVLTLLIQRGLAKK